jgi:hypothetical protein
VTQLLDAAELIVVGPQTTSVASLYDVTEIGFVPNC